MRSSSSSHCSQKSPTSPSSSLPPSRSRHAASNKCGARLEFPMAIVRSVVTRGACLVASRTPVEASQIALPASRRKRALRGNCLQASQRLAMQATFLTRRTWWSLHYRCSCHCRCHCLVPPPSSSPPPQQQWGESSDLLSHLRQPHLSPHLSPPPMCHPLHPQPSAPSRGPKRQAPSSIGWHAPRRCHLRCARY